MIEIDELIDEVFYAKNYNIPIELSKKHYLSKGWKLGFQPNPFFDPKFYLETYTDVKEEKIEPFTHFINYGIIERRKPNIIFDVDYLFKQASEEQVIEELKGYLTKNPNTTSFQLNPHPLFDHSFYFKNRKNTFLKYPPFVDFLNETGASATPCHEMFIPEYYCKLSKNWQSYGSGNPLVFYIKEKDFFAETSIFFDTNYYYLTYIKNNNICPLLHYLDRGYKEDNNPNIYFNEKWYRDKYRIREDIPMILHYLRKGFLKTNSPSPFINESYVKDNIGKNCNISALEILLIDKSNQSINPNPHLDLTWLKKQYGSNQPLVDLIREGIKLNKPLSCTLPMSENSFLSVEDIYNKFQDTNNNRNIKKSIKIKECDIVSHIFMTEEKCKDIGEFYLPIISGEQFRVITGQSTQNEVFCIENALIKSRSRIIWPLNKNYFIHDEHAKHKDVSLSSKDPLLLINLEHNKVATTIKWPEFFIEEAFHLLHEYDENYYHFLIELLPKLLFYKKNKFSCPILVSNNLHKNFYELIASILGQKPKIIKIEKNKWLYISKLIYVDDKSFCGDVYFRRPKANEVLYDYESLTIIKKTLLKKYSKTSVSEVFKQSLQLVYFDRKTGARCPSNREELLIMLEEFDNLEIIDPNHLSIRDQIHFFSHSKVIISPSGAVLSNLIFCQPNTKIFVFIPKSQSNGYQVWEALANFFKVDIVYIECDPVFKLTGKYSVHDDYLVNLLTTKEVISSYLQELKHESKKN